MSATNPHNRLTLEVLEAVASQYDAIAAKRNGSTASLATGGVAPDLARRIRAYLDRVDPAIEGRNGSAVTFRTARTLVVDFGLTVEQATPFMQYYSKKCVPEWTDAQILHKLRDADKLTGIRGRLLSERATSASPNGAASTAGPVRKLRNYTSEEITDGETKRVVKSGRAPQDILSDLTEVTGGYPQRVGPMLYAPGPGGVGIRWLDSANDLAAWAAGVFRSPNGRNNVSWAGGDDCPSMAVFYSTAVAECDNFEAVEEYPHEPEIPGVAYLHPPVAGGDGKALAELMKKFCPATPQDDDLIFAFLMTLFWGGPGGERPLFVFEAAADAANGGRGSGKSTVANLAAKLCGGAVSISMNEDIGEIQRRLLGAEGRAKRMVIMDNIKSLRYSSAEIEGMITASPISGRQMYEGEGQRPNYLTWVFTFNQPSMSSDLANRAVLIRLNTPTYAAGWRRGVEELITTRRWEIIGDILAELRKPSRMPEGTPVGDFRWAEWVNEVLSRCPDPAGLIATIKSRQAAANDDDDQAEEVTEAFRELVRVKFNSDPDKIRCLIPSKVCCEEIVKKQFAKNVATVVHAVRWLNTVRLQQVKYNPSHKPYRGFFWTGVEKSDTDAFTLWDEIPG